MSVNAGTIYSEVRIQLDKLKQDIAATEASFNKFATFNKTQSTAVQSKWTKSFKDINLAGVAAFAGLALAIKNTVKTFAKFEQSLANVRSVAKATPEEFARIEKAALEAGETTRFKASQAADAMYYLASAGFDANQSIDALNGVLMLAGSTQSDLAMTSETVASAISQFGLEAKDAERVANVFTAAITNSQATMDKLATSLRYVGPVASSMNKSIEDTAGLLQILYNNGFNASQAGTALRFALANLSDEQGPVIAKLKELGVSFDEVNPATHTFGEIIGVLNERVNDGGEIMSIFGQRAGPAMIKLIQAGRSEVEKYTEAVTGTNAAAEAYAIQNDTLQGSIDLLSSAVEAAQIKFVKEFTPALRGIIDILTQVIHAISNAPKSVKFFIGILAAGIPIILGVATAVKLLGSAFSTLGGPVGIALGAIAALAGVVAAISEAADTQGQLKTATDELVKSQEELKRINEELETSTKNLTEAEKTQLKIRKEQAEAVNAANIYKMVSALEAEQNALKNLREGQKNNLELQKAIKEVEEGTRKEILTSEPIWSRVFGLRGSGIQQGALYAVQLAEAQRMVSEGIIETDKNLKEHNKTYDDTIARIAELVMADETLFQAIQKQNGNLAQQIKYRIGVIQRTKEQTEADAKAAEEKRKAEEAEKARLAALVAQYNKRMDLVRQVNEAERTEVSKLREKLKELEGFRGRTYKDERARQMAVLALRKNIAEAEKKAAAEKEKQDSKANEILDDYTKKIEELTATQEELIELEHQRAIAAIEASGASKEAMEAAKKAVDEYYAKLADKQAQDELVRNMNTMASSILDGFASLPGAMSQLYAAMTDARINELNRQLEAELEAAGLAEETEVERLKRELAEAQAAGDMTLAAEKEKELQKAQINEKYERKIAQTRYQGEIAQWNMTWLNAAAEAARSIVQAVASAPWPFNLPAIGFATALTGLQLGIIGQSKPQPPAYQGGGVAGIVVGPEGTDRVNARLTAGEMVINRDQQTRLFNAINDGNIGGLPPMYFTIPLMVDGMKLAEVVFAYKDGGWIRVKNG